MLETYLILSFFFFFETHLNRIYFRFMLTECLQKMSNFSLCKQYRHSSFIQVCTLCCPISILTRHYAIPHVQLHNFIFEFYSIYSFPKAMNMMVQIDNVVKNTHLSPQSSFPLSSYTASSASR